MSENFFLSSVLIQMLNVVTFISKVKAMIDQLQTNIFFFYL